ncbi:MAG: hypothetical protein AB1Z18_14830, partial [Desulfobacterales bacterium]
EVKSLKKALQQQTKPAIEAKAPPENAIKQVASKNKAPKRATGKKVTVSKKTASHTKSAD